MAKIYTKTGDAGETGLFGGERVRKCDLRVEAIGSIDETNGAIGVVRVELVRGGAVPDGMDALLGRIQHALFDLGAELAARTAEARPPCITEADVANLEREIDQYDAMVEPLRVFILPGGTAAAAQLHVARCVCRRAERRLVELMASESVPGELLRYLNRLSDLLFVLARVVNKANGLADVAWQRTDA
jgi:cob(I)alamin adenosyltransferase